VVSGFRVEDCSESKRNRDRGRVVWETAPLCRAILTLTSGSARAFLGGPGGSAQQSHRGDAGGRGATRPPLPQQPGCAGCAGRAPRYLAIAGEVSTAGFTARARTMRYPPSASEKRGQLERFQDFYLKAKAKTWH